MDGILILLRVLLWTTFICACALAIAYLVIILQRYLDRSTKNVPMDPTDDGVTNPYNMPVIDSTPYQELPVPYNWACTDAPWQDGGQTVTVDDLRSLLGDNHAHPTTRTLGEGTDPKTAPGTAPESGGKDTDPPWALD